MPDEEPREEQPSLELPSLGGWRRRRRRPQRDDPTPAPEPAPASGGFDSVPLPETETKPPPAAPEPVRTERSTIVLPEPVPEDPPEPQETRARRIRVTPHLPGGYVAVLGAGALVGLLMVGLTWGSLRTCEQVQGTSSCGTAGYPMLLTVLVLAVVAGALLLRLLRVPDPVGTSFLGTGLTTVLALLLLIDHLDRPAMVVVVPLLTAACFAAAHWVTATFIEPGERPG